MYDIDNDYLAESLKPDWSMLDRWHHIQVDSWAGKSLKILEWLDEAQGERFYWTRSGNIWFEREEDWLFFKLTWC